jgi:hypothetical protein
MDIRNIAAERMMASERVSRARKGAAAAGGAFALADDSAETARVATPSGVAIGSLDGLLALQIVDDPTHRRRRSVQRGRTMLDLLDSLKLALLSGRVPKETLFRIARTLRQREPGHDPVLEEIIAEIELRAAVELAKHGVTD